MKLSLSLSLSISIPLSLHSLLPIYMYFISVHVVINILYIYMNSCIAVDVVVLAAQCICILILYTLFVWFLLTKCSVSFWRKLIKNNWTNLMDFCKNILSISVNWPFNILHEIFLGPRKGKISMTTSLGSKAPSWIFGTFFRWPISKWEIT